MKRRHAGFSLVELIIVIALMGILTALLAPQYIKYVSKSRQSVCDANCSTIRQELYAAQIEHGESLTAQNILDATGYTAEGGVLRGETAICPDGGDVKLTLGEGEAFTVVCQKHGASPETAVESFYRTWEDLLVNYADREKYPGLVYVNKPSNDQLRKYYLENLTSEPGKWDAVTYTLNGKTVTKYLQAYLDAFQPPSDPNPPSNNSYLLLGSNQTSSWNQTTNLICYLGKWYQRPDGKSISYINMSFEEIMEANGLIEFEGEIQF